MQCDLRNGHGLPVRGSDDAVLDGQGFGIGFEHAACDVEHLFAHLLGGAFDGSSTDIGGGGGVRASIKGGVVGVGRVDDDIFDAHTEDFGGDLGQHSV